MPAPTKEQQRAVALARARRRQAEASPGSTIPEPINLNPPAPESLEELTGGFVTREGAVGLGGVLGTAAGAPGGPVGAGLGGTLGAVGGSFLFRNTEDLLRRMGMIVKEPLRLDQMLEEGRDEALLDLAIAGGASVARPILASRALIGKIFGVTTDRAKELIASAKLAGVNVGAADVGGTAPRAIVKTLGVFPFTGTPAQRNLAAKQIQIGQRVNSLLDDLAPNATLRNELGLNLKAAADRRFGKFKKIVARLSNRFETLAQDAGDVIPTDESKKFAQEFAEDLQEGVVKLTTGKELAAGIEDKVADYLVQVQNLPERISIKQYRRVVRDLRGIMDLIQNRSGAEFADGAKLKQALEIDLNNIRVDDLPPDQGRKIVDALNTFNRVYSKGMAGFETQTAKRFGRADKNIFGPGPFKAGSLTPDEIADVALNVGSKQAIDDLAAVVGEKPLRQAARNHVENAWRLSTDEALIAGETVQILDPVKLERQLGLSGAKKDLSEGVSALLKRAGVDAGDLKALLTVAKNLENPGDPRTFVMRRVTIGGIGALSGLAGAGTAAAVGAGGATATSAGLAPILLGTFFARKFADIATNPVALKNMITALDTARNTAARRQAFARALTAVARSNRENPPASRPGTRGPKSQSTLELESIGREGTSSSVLPSLGIRG